ncbi:MAG TPA: MarR family transcriptional regulator [Baekduia sp.]|nr:MarR family transcriptional regulator [Baekduia sp.]
MFAAERRRQLRAKSDPPEMSVRQAIALWVIEKGNVTAGDIARSAGMSPATVTAILDELEDAGFVVRGRAPDDRRVVMVEMTEAGRQTYLEGMAWWDGLWETHFADWSDDELLIAIRTLETVTALLEGLDR